MKTIIVEGEGWTVSVDIDEEIFLKYTDMTFEAMTQGVELFFQNKYERTTSSTVEMGLGFSLTAYEQGHKNNIEKQVTALTEYVLNNAAKHELAKKQREEAINVIKKQQGKL